MLRDVDRDSQHGLGEYPILILVVVVVPYIRFSDDIPAILPTASKENEVVGHSD
jgi:hypothetical protein